MVLARLEAEQLLALAGILVIALVGTALFPSPIWASVTANASNTVPNDNQANEDTNQQMQQATHRHGHLFFYVGDERREFSQDYLEREHAAHFHNDDGIFHIHRKGVTIDDLFTAVGVTVDSDKGCITFEPDDEEYCADGNGQELRVYLNNETIDAAEWSEYEVQQGDDIVVYYGDTDGTVPDEYLDKELPEFYQRQYMET